MYVIYDTEISIYFRCFFFLKRFSSKMLSTGKVPTEEAAAAY